MAIYVSENGVCLPDIFIALQAEVTFSGKQNSYRHGGSEECDWKKEVNDWKRKFKKEVNIKAELKKKISERT